MTSRSMASPGGFRAWWPAIGLSLVLHLAWWASYPGMDVASTRPARNPAPVTSFLRDDPGTAVGQLLREDVRAIASPALFSLQTPMGFSRPLVEEHRSLTPPLDPREESLARPGLAEAPGVLDPEPVRVADVEMLRTISWARNDGTPGSATFTVRPVDTGLVVQVIWQTPIEGLKNRALQVDREVLLDDPRAWEATAYVEFDEFGSVRHVMLERPSPSPVRNAGLIRALRGLQAKPTGRVQGGNVFLRFAGDPQKLLKPREATP